MKMLIGYLGLSVLLMCVATSAYDRPVNDAANVTLQNLQTAFNGESNASAKYAVFAKKPSSPRNQDGRDTKSGCG